MAALREVMAYLCAHYKIPDELSKARLTKMIYLADWRSAITQGRQITDIQWQFNHYGPYVPDVEYVARNDQAFEVLETKNYFGSGKSLIRLVGEVPPQSLTSSDREILDEVMRVTQTQYWQDFIRLVYSTYPILTQPRYAMLDLVEIARQYKANPVFREEETLGA